MKRVLFIIYFTLISIMFSAAQPYINGAGFNAGTSSGITLKHFLHKNYAIEAQALFNNRGFQLSAFYEYQFSPYSKERLYYFAGAGPHTGNWNNEFAIGGALLVGTEFTFWKAPLTVGLEWKPMINVYKELDFLILDLALTVKVVLN